MDRSCPPLTRSVAMYVVAALAIALTACAPPPSASSVSTETGPVRAPAQFRSLVMVDRHEPQGLLEKIQAAGTSGQARRLFNAYLVLRDDHGTPHPYLAETIPQLDTDSWRVFPDGRMETTYQLRAGLTWQDSTPLTADDFAFALTVYQNPLLGIFSATPQNLVQEIVAPDARTLVIRWRSPYPDAGELTENTLEALPRHLLEQPFRAMEQDSSARDTFLNLPFWTSQYIGAGPYRLDRWEQGDRIEASAFDGHALGRPRIDRISYRFAADENTILSNVLAGEAQYTTTTSLRVNHAQVLKREWVAADKGTVLYSRNAVFYNHVQYRPEFQKTSALLEVRVRKALAHSIDKQGIIEVLYEGDSSPAHTFVSLGDPAFPVIDRTISKYPYDLRRTEQLLNEAGFSKDGGGFYADANGARFRPDFEVLESVDYERAGQIMNEGWRRAGVDVQFSVLPNAMVRDNERRHKSPGITSPGAGLGSPRASLSQWSSREIGTPDNRWNGSNRGGWADPEFDRLFDAYNSTLEVSARDQVVAQAMKILSDQLPGIPVYYNIYPLAVDRQLRGPTAGPSSETTFWNIQSWELS